MEKKAIITKKSGRAIILIAAVLVALIIGFMFGFFTGKSTVEVEERVVYKEIMPDYVKESLSRQLQTDEPIEFIRQDLSERPGLIPYEGVLGGTMGFYDKERIQVLNDRWVLAPFEDGHKGGYVLLRYDIEEDRFISWQVVESYLY